MAYIEFTTVGQYEKEYNFVDAVAAADMANGTIGAVSNGTFTANAQGTMVAMQVEYGDEAGTDQFEIHAGEHVRVLDLTKVGSVTGNKKIRVFDGATHTVGDTLYTGTVTKVLVGGAEVELS